MNEKKYCVVCKTYNDTWDTWDWNVEGFFQDLKSAKAKVQYLKGIKCIIYKMEENDNEY